MLKPCEVGSGLRATAGGQWNRSDLDKQAFVADPSIVGLVGSFPRMHTQSPKQAAANGDGGVAQSPRRKKEGGSP